ncbi:MAG TPA: GNAT family N-acetyltransferase [Candidatus Binatia bacterium]|nr:GNAT family N-acetyltransferase [Candidatus Binatia bacterium]
MDLHLLGNVTWHALSGPHAHLADGGDRARRYSRGLPALAAFADPQRPDFEAMASLFDVGELVFLGGTGARLPAGWQCDFEMPALQMVWNGQPRAETAADVVNLSATHIDAMVDLVQRTGPGPFGARNLEMGDYVGTFENGELVSMAGERMAAGKLREISAVCTSPKAQGRGYARRLMHELIRRQTARGETPFLHVASFNTRAVDIYRRMGFRLYQETILRILCHT